MLKKLDQDTCATYAKAPPPAAAAPKKAPSTKKTTKEPCPAGKVRNPKTGRCINDQL